MVDSSTIEKVVTLKTELREAEAKSDELAALYGAAFSRFNQMRDRVQHLKTALQEAERNLLDSVQ